MARLGEIKRNYERVNRTAGREYSSKRLTVTVDMQRTRNRQGPYLAHACVRNKKKIAHKRCQQASGYTPSKALAAALRRLAATVE